MRLISFVSAVSVAALFLTGCSQTPPPAPDTREADAKTIRETSAQWAMDWAAKDAAKLAAHYADDAMLAVPNMPVIKGRTAISAALTDMTKDPNFSLNITLDTVDVSKASDIAYEHGTYSMTMTNPKSKKAIQEKGKYVTIYKKQTDGSWKAVQDINNADAPAVPVKAEAKSKKGASAPRSSQRTRSRTRR